MRDVLPDMIDLGIDVLNPIQWRCPGMDRAGLKRDFGDRLVFHGGVDNQKTLAFGTPAQVRAEVADNLRLLGAGGGYILAPCHNIQPVSPPENVVALYEAGEPPRGGTSTRSRMSRRDSSVPTTLYKGPVCPRFAESFSRRTPGARGICLATLPPGSPISLPTPVRSWQSWQT